MEQVWDKLENTFPGWEIYHAGGGNFVVRKDFKDKNGNNLMVSLTDYVALLMKHQDEDRYITHAEFIKNEDTYWGEVFHLEVPIINLDNGELKRTDAVGVFNDRSLTEISDALAKLGEVVW